MPAIVPVLKRLSVHVSAASCALSVAHVALAQTGGDDSTTSASGRVIEQVTVTARNREESLQDIPLAVTAFDKEALKRRNITELEDVARFTAGFAFEDFDGGNANPVIRGQSTLRANAREQTVAVFLDGVYMPRSWAVDLGMTNIERVEIVKGPQSARYGRNAFAGAINNIPVKAAHEFDLNADVTMGSDEREDYSVGITVPVIQDILAVRATYETSEFDGTWDNNHPNAGLNLSPGTEGNVGGWNNDAYSVDILYTPTERLSLNASYYGFEKSEESRAARWLNTGQGAGNCGPLQIGGNPSLFCGTFPVVEDSVVMDPRGFGRQADIDVYRLSAAFDISDALTLTYAYGAIEGSTQTVNTAESDTVNCGTILGPPVFPALCNWQASPAGAIDYEQHELRLSFDNGGALTGSAGLFYMDGLDDAYAVSVNLPPRGTAPIALASESYGGFTNLVFRNESTTTEVQSIFAEVSYALANGLTRFSIEGRYTSEDIATDDIRTGSPVPIDDETFDFFTPRFTVEHDITENSMAFLTAARGAKAGGFNSAAISDDLQVFDPEFNWTYEIGLKNTLMGGKATVNLAAFYTDWTDMQINTLDPLGSPFTATMTKNLGDATIWGVEAEGSILLTENLSLDFAASYTDASYDNGTRDDLFTRGTPPNFPSPCDGSVCEANGEIGGNDLERSPDTQLALGIQWEDSLSAELDYYIRADAGYQSSFFAESINVAKAPSRTVTNASAGVRFKQFDLQLWARNLTDEQYVSNSLQIIQPFSNNILGTYYGERRTLGATLSYQY